MEVIDVVEPEIEHKPVNETVPVQTVGGQATCVPASTQSQSQANICHTIHQPNSLTFNPSNISPIEQSAELLHTPSPELQGQPDTQQAAPLTQTLQDHVSKSIASYQPPLQSQITTPGSLPKIFSACHVNALQTSNATGVACLVESEEINKHTSAHYGIQGQQSVCKSQGEGSNGVLTSDSGREPKGEGIIGANGGQHGKSAQDSTNQMARLDVYDQHDDSKMVSKCVEAGMSLPHPSSPQKPQPQGCTQRPQLPPFLSGTVVQPGTDTQESPSVSTLPPIAPLLSKEQLANGNHTSDTQNADIERLQTPRLLEHPLSGKKRKLSETDSGVGHSGGESAPTPSDPTATNGGASRRRSSRVQARVGSGRARAPRVAVPPGAGFDTAVGFKNLKGTNRCCINAVLQVLWHVPVFTECLEGLVVEQEGGDGRKPKRRRGGGGGGKDAAKDTVVNLQRLFNDIKTITSNPQPRKKNHPKFLDASPIARSLYAAPAHITGTQYVIGQMSDVAEVLRGIYGCIDDVAGSELSPVQRVFGWGVLEGVVCDQCGVVSGVRSFDLVMHTVSQMELVKTAKQWAKLNGRAKKGGSARAAEQVEGQENGMGDGHTFSGVLRELTQSEQKTCDVDAGGCGGYARVSRGFRGAPPMVYTLEVSWQENPGEGDVADTLATLSENVWLNDVYYQWEQVEGGKGQGVTQGLRVDENASRVEYRAVGMFCFNENHWTAICRQRKRQGGAQQQQQQSNAQQQQQQQGQQDCYQQGTQLSVQQQGQPVDLQQQPLAGAQVLSQQSQQAELQQQADVQSQGQQEYSQQEKAFQQRQGMAHGQHLREQHTLAQHAAVQAVVDGTKPVDGNGQTPPTNGQDLLTSPRQTGQDVGMHGSSAQQDALDGGQGSQGIVQSGGQAMVEGLGTIVGTVAKQDGKDGESSRPRTEERVSGDLRGYEWFIFNDKEAEHIGDWDDVVAYCCEGMLQPTLVFYSKV